MKGLIFLNFLWSGSLVALTGLRQFFVDPIPSTTLNLVWFCIQVLPLALTLPSLISGSVKGVLFLCLASMLYFVHGVMAAMVPLTYALGIAEIAFSLMLCLCSAVFIKQRRLLESAASNSSD